MFTPFPIDPEDDEETPDIVVTSAQEMAQLRASLQALISAADDATTEIRDRSFAKKPLIEAIAYARKTLGVTELPK